MAKHQVEFEESEYRGPLYNQLAGGDRAVWEPGQVFEEHIGIDYALFCRSMVLERHLGWSGPYPGVLLPRYRYLWRRHRPDKKPPPFKLNLFIQAKRSEYIIRTPKGFKALGLTAPFWRFDLTPHQQGALQRLEKAVGGSAAVVYAAPLFHRSEDLYRHTERGTIIQHSTFPTPLTLKGHEAWNFSVPEWGVANEDPEHFESSGLLSRLDALSSQTDAEQSQEGEEAARVNLRKLKQATVEAIEGASDFLRARFADERSVLRAELNRFAPDGPARATMENFFTVATFCDLFKLQWAVIGPMVQQQPG